MKSVYKYELGVFGLQEVEMPKFAKILSIQKQRDKLCLWALVDPSKQKEKREIILVGTGHPVELDNPKFLGTVQELGGDLVWHLFEEKK